MNYFAASRRRAFGTGEEAVLNPMTPAVEQLDFEFTGSRDCGTFTEKPSMDYRVSMGVYGVSRSSPPSH